MKYFIFSFFILIITNLCFAQNSDTLFYYKHFSNGTVLTKDTTVGLMNNLFFYDKINSRPITGIVIMHDKPKNFFYYEVYNGIAKKRTDTLGKRTIIEIFGKDKYSSKSYKKNRLHSIYNIEIINFKMYFVKIDLSKKTYRIKQSFFDENKKLIYQKFTVKNLDAFYKLPLLLNLKSETTQFLNSIE